MINNKKIKILFRHRSMEMGGVEKVLLNVVNNLDRSKFDITVCLTLNQGELRNEFPADIRKVFIAEGKEEMSKNSIIQKIQLLRRKAALTKYHKNPELVDKHILKEQYDIEVGMTYNDFDLVLQSSNKKSKKVGWFHSEIQIPKMQPLVPKILEQFPKFDSMIYCSQRIKDLMHEYHPDLQYPNEKVIINAIPIDEIKCKAKSPTERTTDLPVFFSMARLHTRKGFHKLIDAHAQLIKEGYQHKILILGEGEEYNNLVKQREQLGVESTFEIRPFEMNPYPYLNSSDFYILPSESEAWPLVIAEALILQKPTIATDVGDISKMIRDRETGHLIRYDTEEIYNAMKIFLTDKAYINSIKENLKSIDKQFDSKPIYNELENTFINLANS